MPQTDLLSWINRVNTVAQQSGGTTNTEHSALTITAAQMAAAGFSNGDDVLLIFSGNLGGLNANSVFECSCAHGTTFIGRTTFPDSTTLHEPGSTATNAGMPVFYMHRFTYNSSDNIYVAQRFVSGTAANSLLDDTSYTLIRLNDLVENVDYKHDVQTHSGNAPTEYDTSGAAVTLPSDGDDWLIIGHCTWLIDSTTLDAFNALQRDGETLVEIIAEGEDTAEVFNRGLMQVQRSAAGEVWRVAYMSDGASSHDAVKTTLFALRLGAFINRSASDNNDAQTHTALDSFKEIASIAAHPCDLDSDQLVIGHAIGYYTEVTKAMYARVQRGNSDIISGYGSQEQRGNGIVDQTAKILICQDTITAAGQPYLYDMDVAEGVDVSPTYNSYDGILVVISRELDSVGITSIGGDNDVSDGEVVAVVGAGFGASQGGSGKVEIGDSPIYSSATKVEQSVSAWSDTSITITVDMDTLGPGTRYMWVTRNAGNRRGGAKAFALHRAHAFEISLSTHITTPGGDATTQRLTAPGGKSFLAGRALDDSASFAIDYAANQVSEFEHNIRVLPGAEGEAEYEFSLAINGASPTFTDNSPRLTVAADPGGGFVDAATVTSTAESSFAGSGTVLRRGVSALSAESSYAGAGVAYRRGLATSTAESAFAGAGGRIHSASGALSAETTFTGAGSLRYNATGALSGETSFGGSGTAFRRCLAASSAESSFTGQGFEIVVGGSLLVGESSFTGSGSVIRSVAYASSAESSFSGSGGKSIDGSGEFIAESGFAGAGVKSVNASGALSAETTFEGSGTAFKDGGRASSAESSFTGSGTALRRGLAESSAESSFEGQGSQLYNASAALVAESAFAGSGSSIAAGSGALSGEGVLAGSGTAFRRGLATSSAESSFTGQGFEVVAGGSLLVGESDFAGAGTKIVQAALVASTAESSFSGAGGKVVSAEPAESTANASLEGSGAVLRDGGRDLAAESSFEGSGTRDILSPSIEASAESSLVGSGVVHRDGGGASEAESSFVGSGVAYRDGGVASTAESEFTGFGTIPVANVIDSGLITVSAESGFEGSGTLAIDSGAVSIDAESDLAGAGVLRIDSGTLDLEAESDLTLTPGTVINAAAVASSGDGEALGSGRILFNATGDLVGESSLVGSGRRLINATGLLAGEADASIDPTALLGREILLSADGNIPGVGSIIILAPSFGLDALSNLLGAGFPRREAGLHFFDAESALAGAGFIVDTSVLGDEFRPGRLAAARGILGRGRSGRIGKEDGDVGRTRTHGELSKTRGRIE